MLHLAATRNLATARGRVRQSIYNEFALELEKTTVKRSIRLRSAR